jgi:hypothetical protein
VVLAIAHLLLVNRIRIARSGAATQRAQDLERFLALRSTSSLSAGGADGQS